MIMARLGVRQRRFVEAYYSMHEPNAAKAAIAAGFSEKGAASSGARCLSHPGVQEELAKMQAERSKRVAIDADWVLMRLAMEANADIADLYNENGTLKSVHEWPSIWRQGLVSGVDVEEVKGRGGIVVATIRKVKLSERIKRIELIGKHIGVQAFRDQVGLGNPDGSPIAPMVVRLVSETGDGDG